MRVQNTGQDEVELGFTPVPDGTYIYQLMDGVDLIVKEDSESKTIKIPLLVDSVVDGDKDAVGMPATQYVNIIKKNGEENPGGEKGVNNILSMTGLAEAFEKNFPDDIPADDARFIDALKLRLPGKFLCLTHNVVKDDEGRSNVNWTKMAQIKKKGGDKKPKAAPKSSDTDDEAWVD